MSSISRALLVIFLFTLSHPAAGEDLPKITPAVACQPHICQEAAEFLEKGQYAQAADAYEYIVSSVDTPRRELLYYLLASLYERMDRPDEALRSLVRYEDYIRDTPDDGLPEGQRRPQVAALEKRILFQRDRRRTVPVPAPVVVQNSLPVWRIGIGVAALTLGVGGILGGGALAGLAGRCLNLADSCPGSARLAETPNLAIGVTLIIGGVAAGVAGGLLIGLPPQKKPQPGPSSDIQTQDREAHEQVK